VSGSLKWKKEKFGRALREILILGPGGDKEKRGEGTGKEE